MDSHIGDPRDVDNPYHEMFLGREEALMQLNDRCGQTVQVVVHVDVGDVASTVVTTRGTLRHCRNDDPLDRTRVAELRDSLTGCYELGEATVDITDVHDAGILRVGSDAPYGIAFGLSEDVWLTITWDATPNRRFMRAPRD